MPVKYFRSLLLNKGRQSCLDPTHIGSSVVALAPVLFHQQGISSVEQFDLSKEDMSFDRVDVEELHEILPDEFIFVEVAEAERHVLVVWGRHLVTHQRVKSGFSYSLQNITLKSSHFVIARIKT